MSDSTPDIRPASTVIVMRPAQAAPFEVFMVRRHNKSGFMAGAHVFPGGIVEPTDSRMNSSHLHAESPDADACAGQLGGRDAREDARAFFVAAMRETFEESGLLLGKDDLPLKERTHIQAELNADRISFEAVLGHFGHALDLRLLRPMSRWVTPSVERRRYEACFFLARADQEAAHDDVETTAGEWLTPKDAVARSETKDIILPPPTLHTLLHLASQPSIDAAFGDAASRSAPRVAPDFHALDAPTLVLPGDALHPQPQELPGPVRFTLRDGRWQF